MKIFEIALVIDFSNINLLSDRMRHLHAKKVLIVIVGDASSEIENEILERLKNNSEAAFVISSPSAEFHYLDLAKKVMIYEDEFNHKSVLEKFKLINYESKKHINN